MHHLKRTGSVLLLGMAMLAGAAFAADQTLTGTITDPGCGATHKMPDAKKCTNGCAKSGGYALLVGDKVYTLAGKTDGLADLAAEKVKVTGAVDGLKITVSSVAKM